MSPRSSSHAAASPSADTTKFLIDLQTRLLKLVEDRAAQVMMTAARYIPAVLRGYHTGKPGLVRPDPGSIKRFSAGRPGQELPTTRFSALYPTDTTEWLDELGERAGGFNRSHCVIMLLLDWFGINPFDEVFALSRGTLAKDPKAVSATTSMTSRIKSSFTCQTRIIKLLEKAGDPTPVQQYMRTILVSYARGQERAFRPAAGTVSRLGRSRSDKGFDKETVGFYFSPDLLEWIDDLGNRAGGFNRSHTMLLLFIHWLHINPFTSL